MKLKEAIGIINSAIEKQSGEVIIVSVGAVMMIRNELRATQREKRAMWKALSVACRNYSKLSKACYGHVGKLQPCQFRTCPLLKGGAK